MPFGTPLWPSQRDKIPSQSSTRLLNIQWNRLIKRYTAALSRVDAKRGERREAGQSRKSRMSDLLPNPPLLMAGLERLSVRFGWFLGLCAPSTRFYGPGLLKLARPPSKDESTAHRPPPSYWFFAFLAKLCGKGPGIIIEATISDVLR